MELAHWLGELKPGSRRANEFTCEFCEGRGLQHDRKRKQCFRHYERATIRLARVTEQAFVIERESKEVEADAERVLEELDRLNLANPDRGLFDIARMLGVCPTGLIDDEMWVFADIEGAVREYGAGYIEAYGFESPPARLLEAMEVIRVTRNRIEARKWADLKKRD